MAKLQTYKFVNPGIAASASPVATAARQQTLAFNRLGTTVSSIGSVVKDIEQVSILNNKADQKELIAERRRKRKERDAAAEQAAELKDIEKKKLKPDNKLKKVAKGSLSWIEKFLAPIGNFLLSLYKFAITTEVLKWISDEENIKKLEEFLCKADFVFSTIFGWAKGFTENVLNGFSDLTAEDSTFIERIKGLGEMMLGITALKYLMNPFSLIGDILNLLGRREQAQKLKDKADRARNQQRNQRSGRPQLGSGQTTSLGSRPAGFVPRSDAAGNQVAGRGQQYRNNLSRVGQGATTQPLKPSRLRGFTANLQTGTANVPLPAGAQRGLYGGVQKAGKAFAGAKNFFRGLRIPIIGPILMGIGSYMETGKVDQALFVAGGAAIGGALGTLIPIPVLGTLLGETIGGYIGDLMYVLLKGGGPGALGQKLRQDIQKVLSVGKTVTDWIGSGLSRFFEGVPKYNIFGKKVPDPFWMLNPANLFEKAGIFSKAFFSRDPMNETPEQKALRIKQQEKERKELERQLEQQYDRSNQIDQSLIDSVDLYRNGGYLQEMFLGGLWKKVKKVGSSIWKGVTKIASNPIVSTVASFIPGANIVVPAINAINAVSSGNYLGAVMSGLGAVGGFASIGSTAQSMVNTPDWLINLRMSGFGQGVSNLYNQGAKFFGGINTYLDNNPWIGNVAGNLMRGNIGGAITTGLNQLDPRFGNIAGSLFAGDYRGAIGSGLGMIDPRFSGIANDIFAGNFGGAVSGGLSMFDPQLGGIASNIFGGNFMEAGLSGIGMINPNLEAAARSFISDPVATIGSIAEQKGLGGLYKGILDVAGGDYKGAMRTLGAEIGVDPKFLGAAEKISDKVFSEKGLSAEFVMNEVAEFVPIPMIVEKLVPLPTAVPLNNEEQAYTAVSTSLTSRMR